MLYLCSDADQTLQEINYDYQTPVVIAAYRVKQDFNSLAIGADYPEEQITGRNDETLSATKQSLAAVCALFNEKENAKLNQLTNSVHDCYDLRAAKAQAWIFPVVGDAENSDDSKRIFNLAIYPGLASQYLDFAGAIVVSDANPEGRKHVEFCFDRDYRLDYLKGYPELEAIFEQESSNKKTTAQLQPSFFFNKQLLRRYP